MYGRRPRLRNGPLGSTLLCRQIPFSSDTANMLISADVNTALNEQIGHEFAASVQYVAIAAHFECEGLPQLARHFYRQAVEERDHAMRFVKYIVDADGRVEIPAIPAPRSALRVGRGGGAAVADNEMTVTKQINALMDMAIKRNDHITRNFLEWFINEQLEEVSSMDTLLRMIRRAGEKGLLFVESYLAQHRKVHDEAPPVEQES